MRGDLGGLGSVTATVAWVGGLGASLALWFSISADFISEGEWQRESTDTDPVTHPNACQLRSVGETCARVTVGHTDCHTLTRTDIHRELWLSPHALASQEPTSKHCAGLKTGWAVLIWCGCFPLQY